MEERKENYFSEINRFETIKGKLESRITEFKEIIRSNFNKLNDADVITYKCNICEFEMQWCSNMKNHKTKQECENYCDMVKQCNL